MRTVDRSVQHRTIPVRAARCAGVRPSGRRSGRSAPTLDVAAERSGRYVAGADDHAVSTDGGSPDVGADAPAVLTELPDLAAALDDLAAADDRTLAAIERLVVLVESDEVASATGVGVEHWLTAVARQTRLDRRLLVRTCRLLRRLPALATAVARREVSFAQLRGVTLACTGLPTELDRDVDDVIATLLTALRAMDRPDPDVLVGQVRDLVDELVTDRRRTEEDDAHAGRFLHLQPRLDGAGGRFSGQLGPLGLAVLDDATAPTVAESAGIGSVGAARADLLIARLGGIGCDHGPDHEGDGLDAASLAHDPTDLPASDALASDVADTPDLRARLAPPRVLLRLPYRSLLDGDVPADLLTTLTGGRLRLSASAARELLDTAGATLRTVVVDDDGAVLGVGRRTRTAPGWLADAVAAVHDTCTGPGCDRPARGADLDHAAPWWPVDDRPAGTTDVANLGPLCPATNREKEAAGWRTVQTRAGIRTWRHLRSGLTTTTVPSTWRAPGDPRSRRRGPPARGDTADEGPLPF